MAKEYEKYRPLRASSDDGVDEVVNPPDPVVFLGMRLHTVLRRRLVFLILSSQGLLNLVLLGIGLYCYAHRGPSNALFPQSLYCKLLTELYSLHSQLIVIWCPFSAGARCTFFQSS